MDAKITKKRLSALLSYDWLKIVGLCLVLIIVWTLVFTVTATRMRPSQPFTVLNHQANLGLDDAFYDHYSAISNDGVFSYEVIEQNVNDFASNREYAKTLAEARLAVDEGDVMLVPGLFDPATAYKDENTGETAYHRTYVESFAYSFRANVWDVDKYLTGLENYLNGFYDGGWEEGTLNESKVNTAFRARAKANKDKRFKKEAQIKKGVQDDIARIKKYRDALVKLKGYLEEGIVTLVPAALKDENGKAYFEGNLSLNLCPNEDTMGGLKTLFAYQEKYENEEGKEQVRNTAKDMNLVFLKTNTENGFQYEALLYAVNLVETYYTAPQA